MPAIMTHNYRREIARNLVAALRGAGSDKYYIFIGRPNAWTVADGTGASDTAPPTPYDNYHSTDYTAWQGMIAMKKIGAGDVEFAAPNRNWVSGTTYKEYDDRDDDLIDSSYYVLAPGNQVYICLKAGPGTSTSNPGAASPVTNNVVNLAETGDGYIWKYLYTIPTDKVSKFITTGFLPVYKNDAGSRPGQTDNIGRLHYDVQDGAVDGAIYNIKVTSGGTGYTSAPTVSFEGDGTMLVGTATISGSSVTGVKLTNPGAGYTHCTVKFSGGGGSGAVARAVIGPKGGFGKDARVDLQAHHAMLSTTLTQAEGMGDFVVGNDFRQIGVIRNPYNHGTTAVASAATLSALSTLTLNTGAGNFISGPADGVIEKSDESVKGIVVSYDSTSRIVKYMQNESTGFADFAVGNNVRLEADNTVTGVVSASGVGNPEVERYSGEVVYLENRTPVLRASDQIETIKIIFEL